MPQIAGPGRPVGSVDVYLRGKLTRQNADSIINKYFNIPGTRYKDLAEEYRCGHRVIERIINGTWSEKTVGRPRKG